jgi:hypothetical protein
MDLFEQLGPLSDQSSRMEWVRSFYAAASDPNILNRFSSETGVSLSSVCGIDGSEALPCINQEQMPDFLVWFTRNVWEHSATAPHQ